ncbi:MAG: phosphoribosylaminoimidazolesuccinocarboxamide synthase [Acidobacteria bacterium]|nr:phosphoribosylaminoimidazolesuccinocarboxamide synthase [Acidobacteriota bacterium]
MARWAEPLLTTDLPLPVFRRGKVRDVYELDGSLVMVATDRISAFDVVLPNGIPHKGRVLTQISRFWFEQTRHLVPNHLLSTRVGDYPPPLGNHREVLEGRSMLVSKTQPLPVECVARGYLVGSGWKEYQESGSVCGLRLRPGLKECERLDEPIFTPSTKATVGHDANISLHEVEQIVGRELAPRLRDLTLKIYQFAAEYAQQRGILVADTKMEFGLLDGELLLIDELLTPDSSRFWPRESYQPGRGQPSFDKQYVRDYLETLGWDKAPPAPELPPDVVQATSEKYLEAYRLLTGTDLLV